MLGVPLLAIALLIFAGLTARVDRRRNEVRDAMAGDLDLHPALARDRAGEVAHAEMTDVDRVDRRRSDADVGDMVERRRDPGAVADHRVGSVHGRQHTDRHDRRPSFLIIGSARSATTEVIEALGQHPQVQTALPTVKEPHFFSAPDRLTPWARRHRVNDWARYQELFDDDGARAWGEASPGYMDPDDASNIANRIKDRLPDVRLITLLRSPVDRLWSSWLTFEGGDLNHLPDFEGYFCRHLHDMSLGLSPYVQTFGRQRLLVKLFEDMIRVNRFMSDPNLAFFWRDIFAHIGVDDDFEPKLGQANRGGVPRSRLKGKLLGLGPELRNWCLKHRVPQPPDAALAWARRRLHEARQRNLKPSEKMPPSLRRELALVQQPEVERLCAMLDWDAAKLPQEWRAP